MVGWSEEEGSCRIRPMRPPRIFRRSWGEESRRFFRSKRTAPCWIFAFDGRSRRRAAASVLLPEPDSPSTPRISLGASSKIDTREGRTEFARAVGVSDVQSLDFEKGCHAM